MHIHDTIITKIHIKKSINLPGLTSSCVDVLINPIEITGTCTCHLFVLSFYHWSMLCIRLYEYNDVMTQQIETVQPDGLSSNIIIMIIIISDVCATPSIDILSDFYSTIICIA